MTAAKLLFPKRFNEFIYLPLTNKYFLVQGKNDTLTHPFNLLLFAIQLLSVSFFIYLLLKEVGYGTEEKPWVLYIQICAAYAVFIGIKLFIEKIIGNVFNLEKLINQYLYISNNFTLEFTTLGASLNNLARATIVPILMSVNFNLSM